MIFRKTIEHKIEKVLKRLPKYNTTDKGIRYENQIYSHRLMVDGDCVYVKIYYLGDIDHVSVDVLFAYASTMLDKFNYVFQGIARYDLNHEICLTYKKG